MGEKYVGEDDDRVVNQAVWWDTVTTIATSDIFSEQCPWDPCLQCFWRVQHLWNVGKYILVNKAKHPRGHESLIIRSQPTCCLPLDADPTDRPQHERYLQRMKTLQFLHCVYHAQFHAIHLAMCGARSHTITNTVCYNSLYHANSTHKLNFLVPAE
jgi:hypothetical protein